MTSVGNDGETTILAEAWRAAHRLLEEGQSRLAIPVLEQICPEQPESAAARVNLGIAYRRSGQIHEAEEALDEAEHLAPGTFSCEVAFAEFHARLGFFYRAVVRVDRALGLPAPSLRAQMATIELQQYCREHSKRCTTGVPSSPLAPASVREEQAAMSSPTRGCSRSCGRMTRAKVGSRTGSCR